MALSLVVKDETVRGEALASVRVRLDSVPCSARQIIEQRVLQEARRFNLERPVMFRSLVRPADADETSQGWRLKKHRDLDAQAQVAAALEACAHGTLTVHIGGKPVLDLDQPHELTFESQVAFVTLMPIIGG